jgi:hypothetical protein
MRLHTCIASGGGLPLMNGRRQLIPTLLACTTLLLARAPALATEIPSDPVIQPAPTAEVPGDPTGSAAATPRAAAAQATSAAGDQPDKLAGERPAQPAALHWLTVDWDASLASKYLFQGIDYSDGKPVLQPEVTVSVRSFSAILWVNHDLHTQQPNEVDLFLQYNVGIPRLDLTTGYARNHYPHREGWDPSQEVYLDLSCDAPLSPSLSVHYDFDAGKGSYSTLSLDREVPNPLRTMSAGLKLYYQNNYYEATGFPSLELHIGTEQAIGPFKITPSMSRFITWPNGGFRDENAVSATWYLAVNVAQTF